MDQTPLIYVSSPQGWWRFCVGGLALALPLFVWFLVLNSGNWEYVNGDDRLLAIMGFVLLVLAAIVIGGYCLLFYAAVTIDPVGGGVQRVVQLGGVPLYRRRWRLAEFQCIRIFHRPYGRDGYSHKTSIGLRTASGFVVWLRVFDAVKATPTTEAMEFAGELGETLGVGCETNVT
jgi:hypothetical protein